MTAIYDLRIRSLIDSPGPEAEGVLARHAGSWASRLVKRHRTIGTTNRAAEGLRPIVDVAKFAEIQPGITPADVTLPSKAPHLSAGGHCHMNHCDTSTQRPKRLGLHR